MVAQSENPLGTKVLVFQCVECRCYVISVGTMERASGFALPSNCLSVTGKLLPCGGQYGKVEPPLARRILAHLGKAISGNVTVEISEQQLKGGEKR